MDAIKTKRMKSIDEAGVEWHLSHPDADKEETWKAGANYVLEKFVDIVNKNTKPNGMQDRAQMASDMLILIAQLKK